MKTYTISGCADGGGNLTVTIPEIDCTLKAKGKPEEIDLDIAAEIFKQSLRRKGTKKRVEIEHTYLGDNRIPVLRCHPIGGKDLPLVIFIHGYTGNKALDAGRGIQLAEAGFHCVVVDARLHGERRPQDFDRKFRPDRWVSAFFNVLKGTAKDISTIIDLLADDPKCDVSRTGVTGISMGGFITFIAAVREKRIKAAAPMIGSPDLMTFARYPDFKPMVEKIRASLVRANPVEHTTRLAKTALLVQNGAADRVVSVQGARKLDRKMQKLSKTMSINYRYLEYPDLGHEVPDGMMNETIAWFTEWL